MGKHTPLPEYKICPNCGDTFFREKRTASNWRKISFCTTKCRDNYKLTRSIKPVHLTDKEIEERSIKEIEEAYAINQAIKLRKKKGNMG